jgi:hypothetical protein
VLYRAAFATTIVLMTGVTSQAALRGDPESLGRG